MRSKKYGLTVLVFNLLIVIYCAGSIPDKKEEKSFDNLLQKAIVYKYKDPDSSIYFALQAYTIADKNNNPEQQLDALFVLIKSKIKSRKLIEALRLCDTAQYISTTHNLLDHQIKVLINLGNVYQTMGFAAEALKIFFEAQNNLTPNSSTKDEADLFYYIALVYYELGEIEECHTYLRLSLSTALNINYFQDAFSSYMLFSNTMFELDSIQKYIDNANRVIQDHPELIYEKVVLRNNQALYNKAIGNYELSRKQYLEAIQISKQNGFKDYLSTTYNNYAYLLMAETKYDSAKYYLDQALDIAIEIKNLDMESEIYDSYSDLYEKISDYKSALAYSDLFTEKRDQYRQQQQIQKSLFLSAVFDTEQKEKEILQNENEINRQRLYIFGIIAILAFVIGLTVLFIQKFSLAKSRMESMQKGKALDMANAIIQGQDSERKRLAMDLHDGLGARLGALRFLVDGFFKTHKNYNEVSNSIIDIHQSIRNMSHRMSPPELERLGLVETINNFVAAFNESDKFTVLFETNLNSRLSAKLEINIYFLIYELLNNATRHSKGDTIFVQLLKHDDVISLSVEDNGGGFEYDKNKEGMGLKNIRVRVEYLGGKLNIESNPDDTLFMIEIPNNKHD